MGNTVIIEIKNRVMDKRENVYISTGIWLNKSIGNVNSKIVFLKNISLTWKPLALKLSLGYNIYWAHFPALVGLNCRELISDSGWLRSSCSYLLCKWSFLGNWKGTKSFTAEAIHLTIGDIILPIFKSFVIFCNKQMKVGDVSIPWNRQ